MSNYKYTPEIVDRMKEVASAGVTKETVKALHEELGFPPRSIAAKLRSLNFEVPSSAEAPKFSPEETVALSTLVTSNSGQLTAEEIAGRFMNGKFSTRQIMGKVLALELTSHVKKADKKVKPKTYTDAEEAVITRLVGEGKCLEDIAAALNKPVNSVRGKLLSMDLKAPQRDKKTPVTDGSYPGLKDVASTMTVAELAAHYGKTERGVKTALSRREVNAKDYQANKKAA